jgi:hypothetical protein
VQHRVIGPDNLIEPGADILDIGLAASAAAPRLDSLDKSSTSCSIPRAPAGAIDRLGHASKDPQRRSISPGATSPMVAKSRAASFDTG